MLSLGHSNNDLLTHSADDIKMLSGKCLQGEAFFSPLNFIMCLKAHCKVARDRLCAVVKLYTRSYAEML